MTPSVQKHIGGNIMIDFIWICIARSMDMVDLVTQRNRLSSMVQNTTLSMQRIARLNAVDIATGLDFRFSAPLSFRFVFDIVFETNDIF